MDQSKLSKFYFKYKYYIHLIIPSLIVGLVIQLRWFYFHGGISFNRIVNEAFGKELVIVRLILSPLAISILFIMLYHLLSYPFKQKNDFKSIQNLSKSFWIFGLLILWRIFIYKYWYLFLLLATFFIVIIAQVPYFSSTILKLLKYTYNLFFYFINNIFYKTILYKKIKKHDFLCVFIIGIIAIWWLFKNHFGFVVLNPLQISWLMSYDWAQHFLGWQFYRNAPWDFPIGKITDFFYPIGTNIGYTDSIPLIAIPLKLFNKYLPPLFQYIGIWFLICYILQALFAILLLRTFKFNRFPLIIGMLFLLFAPPLLARFPHPSLCAHWLIIGSLWLWFYSNNKQKQKKAIAWQIILLILSSLIHPYLCFITYAFTIALLWKIFNNYSFIGLLKFFTFSIISFFIILINWYIIGYIGSISDSEYIASGFGWFSANLNTFFNGGDTSSFFKKLPVYSDGQFFEGYAYMGLGIILMLAIILFVWLLKLHKNCKIVNPFNKNTIKRNIALIIVVFALYLLSLSNIITLGKKVVFIIPIDEFLNKFLFAFRSSGRFIWPLYYLIFLFVIVYFGKQKFVSSKISNVILVSCLIIQFVDIKPLTYPFYLNTNSYEESHSAFSFKKWEQLYANVDNIMFYPPFDRHYLYEDDYIPFTYLAAKMKKKINIGYLARSDKEQQNKALKNFEAMIDNGKIPSSALIVTTPYHIDRFYNLIYDFKIGFINLDGYYAGIVPYNPLYNDKWKVSMEDILSIIKNHNDRIIFFAVKDKATQKMPLDFKEYMINIGSKVDALAYRGSWAGIIYKGKLIYEQINNNGQVEIKINKNDVFNGIIFPKNILLCSAGNEFGNKASIIIDNVDYSRKMRGINLVITDDSCNVVSTINADTYYGFKALNIKFY